MLRTMKNGGMGNWIKKTLNQFFETLVGICAKKDPLEKEKIKICVGLCILKNSLTTNFSADCTGCQIENNNIQLAAPI